MTKAELERLRILQEVQEAFDVSVMPTRVSERQRLLRGLEARGAASVPSKKRGKPPNNRVSETVRAQVLERCRGDIAASGRPS